MQPSAWCFTHWLQWTKALFATRMPRIGFLRGILILKTGWTSFSDLPIFLQLSISFNIITSGVKTAQNLQLIRTQWFASWEHECFHRLQATLSIFSQPSAHHIAHLGHQARSNTLKQYNINVVHDNRIIQIANELHFITLNPTKRSKEISPTKDWGYDNKLAAKPAIYFTAEMDKYKALFEMKDNWPLCAFPSPWMLTRQVWQAETAEPVQGPPPDLNHPHCLHYCYPVQDPPHHL